MSAKIEREMDEMNQRYFQIGIDVLSGIKSAEILMKSSEGGKDTQNNEEVMLSAESLMRQAQGGRDTVQRRPSVTKMEVDEVDQVLHDPKDGSGIKAKVS